MNRCLRFCGEHRVALGVFTAALAVRLIYLIESADNPTFYTPIIDAYHHVKIAVRASEGDLGGLFSGGRSVYYPSFLSALFFVLGPSVIAAKLCQAVLGALTCTLTYAIGRQLFGRGAGLLAASFVALNGPLFFWELELVGAGWAAFWSVLLLALLLRPELLRFGDIRSTALRVALGVAGGLACLTRPTFLPFVLASTLWLVWLVVREQRAVKHPLALVAAVALGFAVVTLPTSGANFLRSGRFGMFPAVGGLNLFIGNNPDRCKSLQLRPGPEFQQLRELPGRNKSESAQAAFFYGAVANYAVSEPGGFVAGLVHKARQYANGREVPRNISIYVFRDWSNLLSATVFQVGRFGFPWGLLFPLACLGVLLQWRRIPAPILLFATLYPATTVLVFVAGRYRAPVIPVVCILAGAGCTQLFHVWRSNNHGRAAAATAIALGIAVATSLQPLSCEERLNARADLYSLLGNGAVDRGNARLAERYLLVALHEDPNAPKANFQMGRVHATLGRWDEAIGSFDRSISVQPNHLVLYSRAVAYYFGKTDLAAARRDLAASLERRPGFGPALLLYGDLHLEEGSPELARDCWERAQHSAPDVAKLATERLHQLQTGAQR